MCFIVMTIMIFVMSSDHLPLYCLVPSAIYETVSCKIVFFSQFTPDLSGECVVESLAFCVVFCIFVVCLLTIVLSISLQYFLECLYYIFTDFHIFLIIFGFFLMLLFLEIYVYSTYAIILYKSIHSYLLCWNRNVRLM